MERNYVTVTLCNSILECTHRHRFWIALILLCFAGDFKQPSSLPEKNTRTRSVPTNWRHQRQHRNSASLCATNWVGQSPQQWRNRVLSARRQKQWNAYSPQSPQFGGCTGPESKMLCNGVTIMPKQVGSQNCQSLLRRLLLARLGNFIMLTFVCIRCKVFWWGCFASRHQGRPQDFFPRGHRRRKGSLVGMHHGECGARAYNGGPGAEPLVRGSGGQAPLKLKAFWSLDVQRSRQI